MQARLVTEFIPGRWKPWVKCAMPTLLALLLLCSGCIVVPVPESGRKVTTDYKQKAARLMNSAATRDKVVRELGQPAWDFPDLRVMDYHWSATEWGFFWAWAVWGESVAGDFGYKKIPTHRLLWLSFDEQDHLTRWKLTRLPITQTRTRWEMARRWLESNGAVLSTIPPKQFVPVVPPPGQALLHLFWSRGKFYSRIAEISVNEVLRAEIRAGAFTTFAFPAGECELTVALASLRLQAAAGQVLFVEFQPAHKSSAVGMSLVERSESSALAELKQLEFCK